MSSHHKDHHSTEEYLSMYEGRIPRSPHINQLELALLEKDSELLMSPPRSREQDNTDTDPYAGGAQLEEVFSSPLAVLVVVLLFVIAVAIGG